MPTVIACTICSRSQNPCPEPIPAKNRFVGRYVRWFLDRGAFGVVARPYLIAPSLGLVDSDQDVPYVDTPLRSDDEIPLLAMKVAEQLRQLGVREVHFFRRTSPASSSAWERYLEAIKLAAAPLSLRVVVDPIPEMFY